MMPPQVERRLTAIMAADVVGYSRLMDLDEQGTLAALKARRKRILEPLVRDHRGRIVKLMGDGVLVEFASAVNAVTCAVNIQKEMVAANQGLHDDRHIVLRIGINLGDVVVEGGDLFGDGVILAVRLQVMAGPGDICVSGSVYDQIKRKLTFAFDELGLQTVKNIAEPVPVYRIGSSALGEKRETEQSSLSLPLPPKPSIAVLPFKNMSNDPEQEAFVDGLTEDLITDLSRRGGLFVIASHSAFAYKDRHGDVRHIARELGVRYLLEGNIRRAAGRVRINAELIDAVKGDHLWAERFDHTLEDIFAVQDEVSGKIVEALAGRLMAVPARNRPANLEAYELCIRARPLAMQTAVAAKEAVFLLERAIALDPEYAEAHRWLAWNLWLGWEFWGESEPNRTRSLAEAQQAVVLDPKDAGNHWVLGIILAHEGRLAEADAEFDVALTLNPNHADAWAMRSDLTTLGGRPAEGIEQVRKALRLNPHPPGWYYWQLGQAQYAISDYEAAIQTLRRPETYRTTSRRLLAASLAKLGRLEEARCEAELFMLSNPKFTIRHWSTTQPFRNEDLRRHFLEGYRLAGLPE